MRVALARTRMVPKNTNHLDAEYACNITDDIDDHLGEFPCTIDSDDHRDGQRRSHQLLAPLDIDSESTGQREPAFTSRKAEHRLERKRTALAIAHPSGQRNDALLETSISELLEIRDSLAANPRRSIRIDIYTFLIDLIAANRRSDVPSVDSVSTLNDMFRRIVAERASSATHSGNRDSPHERVQHLNALVGLLVLNICRPTPPMQRENALARLLALRRAASVRGGRANSDNRISGSAGA
ncbi:hypothetical protein [Burkholderia lata]|uniref:hypothetical protein n=1 Tax=Burkholderia lata (strain ATCC 17760 / DSM 23089 / LMG 22485 / NCIMB 9086 / R18194 / 383) TaxID=482957 RepID=UPI0015828DA4|nr:hypothetical protein [Burkholderia lata]